MKNRDIMEKYIDSYMAHLDEMLKYHEEKFTIFAGDRPLGFFDTGKRAYEEGIKEYGMVPMLIRKVSREYIGHGRYGKPVRIFKK